MSNHQNKDSLDFIISLAAIFILIGLAWHFAGHFLTNNGVLVADFLIRATNLLYPFVEGNQVLTTIFFFFFDETLITHQEDYLMVLRSIDIYRPSMRDGWMVFTVIGYFFRIPIVLIGLYCTKVIYSTTRPSQMKRSFDIFSLAHLLKKHYPSNIVTLNENLHEKSFDEGPFRQEASPFRFAVLNKAMKLEYEDQLYTIQFGKGHAFNEQKQTVSIQDNLNVDEGMPVAHGKCQIDIKPIRKAFQQQIECLGKWEGSDQLPEQIRALYAVFLLYIKGGEKNVKRGVGLLKQFNRTYKQTKERKEKLTFDTTGVDAVIKEFEDTIAVNNVIKKHHYTIIVLMALFYKATHRKLKLPPSHFLWLKEVNRTLWYALNQNLSPACWTEAAGCRGMILAEEKLGRPINYPFTDNAIKGFLNYLNYEGWFPVDATFTKELESLK